MSTLIDRLVRVRRQQLARGPGPAVIGPRWGLALSGGGIRSATFCFGLLRALAHQRLLLRFDLLSTVSGGGYIAATLGRLFSRCRDAGELAQAEQALGDDTPRWYLWWLRANGRYLIPSGAKDSVFALALYLRNLLAIHVELGLIGLLIGAAIVGFDLGMWQLRAAQSGGALEGVLRSLTLRDGAIAAFLPAPLLLLPLPLFAAVVLACAYWAAPLARRQWPTTLAWLAWAFALGLLGSNATVLIGTEANIGFPVRLALWISGSVLAAAWLLALPLAAAMVRSGAPDGAEARNRLTRALSIALWALLAVLALAAIDRLAWAFAFEWESWLGAGIGLAVAAAVVRALLPLASVLTPSSTGIAPLLRLGSLLGMAIAFLLLTWWVSLLHRAALGAVFVAEAGREGRGIGALVQGAASSAALGADAGAISIAAGVAVLCFIAVPALLYTLITQANLGFLNASSLHVFYRARLVRGYLGAVNPQRFATGAGTPATALTATLALPPEPAQGHSVTGVGEVDADDDLPMHAYRGYRVGAPVHLMTACVNQTRDPRGGLYNRDRRGLPLTIGPGGWMRVGQRPWRRAAREAALTLGHWMAISGAALAPGLGQNTRGGIAALATFAGVRLGYWWEGLAEPGLHRRVFAKVRAVLDETVGRFPGTDARAWFLTDGGHAENTGAYALLAERCGLIVLADCSADPTYRFEDIENLVRRARIDLQTEIRMLKPKPGTPPAPFDRFGSLDDLASSTSQACFALAELRYPGGGIGHLVIVKPNVWADMPPDLANYRAQNPTFPQQTTADQFFDEAQWESYFKLGAELGGALVRDWMTALAAHAEQHFTSGGERATPPAPRPLRLHRRRWGLGAPVLVEEAREAPPAESQAAKSATGRLAARLSANAVATSLSLGAAATAGVSVWQAIDAVRNSIAQQEKDERAALKEIGDLWAKLSAAPTLAAAGAAPAASGVALAPVAASSPAWAAYIGATATLAGALARTSDTLCPRDEAGWFTHSALALSVFDDTINACRTIARTDLPPSCAWLLKANDPKTPERTCLAAAAQELAPCKPRYWGYDYRENTDAPRCVAPTLAQWRDEQARAKQASELAARADTARAAAQAAAASAAWAASAAATAPPAMAASAAAAASAAGANAVQQAQAAASVAAAAAAASAAVASAQVAPSPEQVCGAKPAPACCGTTVYLQIHGPERRDVVRAWREPWRALGASVPPIEDVLASARARNRVSPQPVAETTVRYAAEDALACAAALAPAVGAGTWKIERLPPAYRGRSGVLEVWVPPVTPRRAAAE